jgi:hypothetical protein
MQTAIRAVASAAVFPPPSHDAATGEIRVAGWDPAERRENAVLLRSALRQLRASGWRDAPEQTDSDDASALLTLPGRAKGRLYVSNGGFLFTGMAL